MLHQSILARTQQLKSTVQSKICNRGCDKPALDSGEHSTQNSVKSLNIVRGLTYNRTLIPYDCMHNYVIIGEDCILQGLRKMCQCFHIIKQTFICFFGIFIVLYHGLLLYLWNRCLLHTAFRHKRFLAIPSQNTGTRDNHLSHELIDYLKNY